MGSLRILRSGVIAAVLLAAAAGCATRKDQQEQRVAAFTALLPGAYATLPADDAAAGEAASRLAIVRIRVPLVGQNVFYVQETALADARRVLSQRVWSVAATADGRGVELVPHELVEPSRWRDGDAAPDLFKSMLPQDLRPRADCALALRDEAGRWRGRDVGDGCRITVPGAPSAQRLTTEVELGDDGIAIAERRVDASGTVVVQRTGDPFRRYRRSGG